MALSIVDPEMFLNGGAFFEERFFELAKKLNWEQYRNQNVLVRGCSAVVPPWAYMYITARLAHVARTVRYGNEHDNIVVYRATRSDKPTS